MLYTKEEVIEKLKYFEDPKFRFNAKYHKYFYGNTELQSVTKFIKNFHKPFDTEKVTKHVAKQQGISEDEVQKTWQKKTNFACDMGTLVHEYFEYKFTDGVEPQMPSTDTEEGAEAVARIQQVEKYLVPRLSKLTPIRQELRMFSQKLGLAGTLDNLSLRGNKLGIYDYKTNGSFKAKGGFSDLLYPFQDYIENHLTKYSIQLSIYDLMLEMNTGLKVSEKAIIYIPASFKQPQIIKCYDFKPILKQYFKEKLQVI